MIPKQLTDLLFVAAIQRIDNRFMDLILSDDLIDLNLNILNFFCDKNYPYPIDLRSTFGNMSFSQKEKCVLTD
jgi:hypothetical protein